MLQQDQQWLEQRRQTIGASEIAGVLNKSPWASPWSVWAEKVGLGPGVEMTEQMETGLRAEDMILQWWADTTDTPIETISHIQEWRRHPEYPHHTATLDGMVDDTEPLELKFTNQAPWVEIPEHYRLQALWQAHVTGAERVHFGVLHVPFGRATFRTYIVDVNPTELAAVVEQVEDWWQTYVVTGTMPPVDNSTATIDAVADAYPTHIEGETVIVDTDTATLIEHYRKAKAELDDLTNETKALKAELTTRIKTAETVLDQTGNKLLTYKSQPTTRIDVDRLRTDHPDLAAAYSNTTNSRVLRLTKQKDTTP